MLNLNLSLNNTILKQQSNPPFVNDSETFWFNFTSGSNTVDNTGTPTVSAVPETLRVNRSLIQTTKDLQPLQVANGINFNQTTNRALLLNSTAGITNGKTGWYVAFNIKPATTDCNILNISRNVSSLVSSRGQIEYTASGNLAVRASSTSDGSSTILYGAASIAVGNAFTCQVQMNSDGGTNPLTIWTNVVGGTDELQRDLVAPAGVAFPPFAATDPAQITFGNNQVGGKSFNGPVTDLIFYNGIPTLEIRNNIAAYLFARRALL